MSDYTDSAVCEYMWAGFIMWAWEQPGMRARFTDATGISTVGPRSAIEALVDDATGATNSKAAAFVEWVTRNHWGIDEAPTKYRESLKTKPVADERGKR